MQTKEQEKAIERLKTIENEVVELKKIINKKVYGDIRDRVSSYEDACQIVGVDPKQFLLDRSKLKPQEIANSKLQIIIEALNEGWTPDFSNKNQQKWYPWFRIHPCFELVDCFNIWFFNSDTPSLFLFKNKELCEYAANQFLDIYKDLIAPSNR